MLKLIRYLVNIYNIRLKHKSNTIICTGKNEGKANYFVKGLKVRIKGKNNQIVIKDFNNKIIDFGDLKIKISGSNNRIILSQNLYFSKSEIFVYAQDSFMEIDESKFQILHTNFIFAEKDSHNTFLKIGKNFSSNGCGFAIGGSNIGITIGQDCMFSYNTEIRNYDGHKILNKQNEVINTPTTTMNIGDHVWMGADSKILKDVSVASNTIIGVGSIVTKTVDESNVAIAGIPAKIVKKEVNWER